MKDSAQPIFEASSMAAVAAVCINLKGQDPEYSIGESKCVTCGDAFPYRWITGTDHEIPSRCIPCHDAAVEAAHAESGAREQAAAQRERRTRGVPLEYSENEISQFPAAWEIVRRWDPSNGRGLGLIGPTGLCKTRMIYQRLMDLREQQSIRFLAMRSFRLQQAIQHQWSDEELKRTIKKTRETPILFLDDIGKQKFTDGSEPELFDIIEDRTSNRRPIVFTSNHTGQRLETMMSDNVAGPFLRRIREFCDVHVVEQRP